MQKPKVVNGPPGCFASECGMIGEIKVSALTDGAGPQVVVRGGDIHNISRQLKDHDAAVELGMKLVSEQSIDSYKEWINLKVEGEITLAKAILQAAQVMGRI